MRGVHASHPENDARKSDDSRRGQSRLSGEYEREVSPERALLGKPYERRQWDDDREHFRRLSFTNATRRTRQKWVYQDAHGGPRA